MDVGARNREGKYRGAGMGYWSETSALPTPPHQRLARMSAKGALRKLQNIAQTLYQGWSRRAQQEQMPLNHLLDSPTWLC